MNTLLLDRSKWDLCLDSAGNIAMATDGYAVAQDVASAQRLFAGELYYDTSQGVPHFQKILGHQPSLAVVKTALVTAALTVPDVDSAVVYIQSVVGREIVGQTQVKTADTTVIVGGNVGSPAP